VHENEHNRTDEMVAYLKTCSFDRTFKLITSTCMINDDAEMIYDSNDATDLSDLNYIMHSVRR
jgi:hypothetical protein